MPVRRLLLPALLAAALGGCAGDDDAARPAESSEPVAVDLALDFTPNAVHAPIYTAVREGLDRREGVRIRIRKPSFGPDALKLVTAGKVTVGVLDIHDLAIAREKGADLVAVGALVSRPLAALIAQADIRRPRELAGRTVGVSGLASDPAFLRAIVEHDGGDYERIRQVTIGFTAVRRLLTRRVDAVPAFWNAEGVVLREKGLPVREFRIEEFGAPPYPEVVVITARKTLERRREHVRALVRALAAGVRATSADPEAAVQDIARAGNSDPSLVRAQLDAVMPLFAPSLELDRSVLERWADFDERIGLVERRPDVDQTFVFDLAGSDSSVGRQG